MARSSMSCPEASPVGETSTRLRPIRIAPGTRSRNGRKDHAAVNVASKQQIRTKLAARTKPSLKSSSGKQRAASAEGF